ncbi:MAG: pimeloyl-ACP methyl ester carboxylesterase [Lysobacterales bacterium]|jgi:pimeloyl-ACP methyl ester carboxylesterase
MLFEVNGKQVFATTGGKEFDRSKPVIIFLHGSGLDHTFWGLHTRFFAFRKYAVLALDLPGHTHSEGPPLSSIEAMADWLNDVVEALEINNISIVAHSQGCLTALEFASRYPDKIRSVSLITSGLATPVNPALIEAAESKPESAIAMMLGWGFGSAGHLHQGPIPGNSMVAGGRKVMRGNVPNELAADLKACDAYANGKQAADLIRGPVQVILAGKDRMAPAKATAELVAHLNNPEVHVIAESGHMLPLEAPDECRSLLKSFIFSNNPSS